MKRDEVQERDPGESQEARAKRLWAEAAEVRERLRHIPDPKARLDHCPNKDQHELGPEGYIPRFEWAQEKMKTHLQKQCPGCGLWVIWEEKT